MSTNSHTHITYIFQAYNHERVCNYLETKNRPEKSATYMFYFYK